MSNPIVSFDEEAVKSELRELVRKTIEETINAMLDEEADQLVGAAPYERTDGRAAYRAGHYKRGFTTTSGQVTVKMPKLKGMRFATAVIERCKRRETSVEEAIIEMYLAGVSTRRIEDVGEILWGAGVSAGTVSNLNDRAFKAVDEWRCRPLPVVTRVPRAARRAHVRGRQGGRYGRLDRRGLPWRQNTSAAPCTSTATSSPRFRNRRGRRRRPCSRRSTRWSRARPRPPRPRPWRPIWNP